MANMRAPPSGNLLAELIVIRGLVNTHWALTVQLGLLIFLSGAYTLIVYSASQQRQKKAEVLDQGPAFLPRNTNLFPVSTVCVLPHRRSSGSLVGPWLEISLLASVPPP
jgi:NADH:ubiquinone oxidoreductase subunit 4 (subunit M)